MIKIDKWAFVRHYSIPIILSAVTFVFGNGLLSPESNVVNLIYLFPKGTDTMVGMIMMFFAIGKVASLYLFSKKVQKAFLIGIAVCWLLIGWSYLNNPISSMSHIMAFGFAAICYVELWRGDFAG